MHGDEYEAGKLFESFILTDPDAFPPFVFVPVISPSAVQQKTRTNIYGHDINRHFTDSATDPEALQAIELFKQFSCAICIDIHEDPDRTNEFYFYDSGRMTPQELYRYNAIMQLTDAILYSGVDDTSDDYLGCDIHDGYYSFKTDFLVDTSQDAGFSSKWMVRNGVAKRVFTVEIPGKAPTSLKQSLIASIVPFLMTFTT